MANITERLFLDSWAVKGMEEKSAFRLAERREKCKVPYLGENKKDTNIVLWRYGLAVEHMKKIWGFLLIRS